MEGMLRERAYSNHATTYMVSFSRQPDGWTWKKESSCGSVTFLSAPLRHADIKDAAAQVERFLDEFEKSAGAWSGDGIRIWDDRGHADIRREAA